MMWTILRVRWNRFWGSKEAVHMRRASQGVFGVLRGVIFVGFTVQIIFGLGWSVQNFTKIQHFAADTTLVYPLLERALEGVGKLLHIPYFCILYLLQAGAAAWAVLFFLKTLDLFEKNRFLKVWAVLAVLTNLMVVQCLFAKLPNSFLAGGLILLIALCVRQIRDRKVSRTVSAVVLWGILSVFGREYLLFGAVVLILEHVILLTQRSWKRGLGGIFAVLLFALIMNCGYSFLEKKGVYFDKAPTLTEAAFSRFTWNTVLFDDRIVLESVGREMSMEDVLKSQNYADVVFGETIPALKKKLGEEETLRFLREAVKEAWQAGKKTILHDMMWDFAGYLIPPYIVGRQLDGEGFRSLNVRNYEIMGRNTPVLTQNYMYFETVWFPVSVLTAFLCLILKRILWGRGRKFPYAGLFCVVTAISQALWYTVTNGEGFMDYKKAAVIVIFWEMFIIFTAFTEAKNESEQEELG